jgi:uncharacterized glyoxalase superfamily protein PhnB
MKIHATLAATMASTHVLVAIAIFFSNVRVVAEDLNLSPTRPTVANSVTMQNRGVLQVETGYDVFPQSVPGDRQTVDTTFTYTPLTRLRLDFGWSTWNHREEDGKVIDGVGTISVGGKIEIRKDHPRLPALGLQYSAELPTASENSLQGYGQQIILILNHHYGKNGKLNVIVNGSMIQYDCHTFEGCSYAGQQSAALSYHIQKKTRAYAEVFSQNVPQSNAPPGTYFFGGVFYQFTDSFGLNGGMRFGLIDHSASVGATIGLVFGKHL